MTDLEGQVAAVLRPIVASLYVDSDRHDEIAEDVISLVRGAIADEIENLPINTFGDRAFRAKAANVARDSVSPPLEPATTEKDAVL